jgi:hypothetical protein
MRHGGKVVFFGRFVSVLRAWAAFLAGVDRMAWPKFLAYNAAGGILWAAIYGTAAYLLGDAIRLIARPVAIGLGIVAAVIILGFLIYVRQNYSRLADDAARALPGSLDQYRARHLAKSSAHNGDGVDAAPSHDDADREDSPPAHVHDVAPGEDT